MEAERHQRHPVARGKTLTIENCDIFGFTTHGIDIATAGGKVLVLNTVSSNNGGNGITVNSTNTTRVDIRNSTFAFNNNGVNAGSFSIVTATGTDASSNTQAGWISSARCGYGGVDCRGFYIGK